MNVRKLFLVVGMAACVSLVLGTVVAFDTGSLSFAQSKGTIQCYKKCQAVFESCMHKCGRLSKCEKKCDANRTRCRRKCEK